MSTALGSIESTWATLNSEHGLSSTIRIPFDAQEKGGFRFWLNDPYYNIPSSISNGMRHYNIKAAEGVNLAYTACTRHHLLCLLIGRNTSRDSGSAKGSYTWTDRFLHTRRSLVSSAGLASRISWAMLTWADVGTLTPRVLAGVVPRLKICRVTIRRRCRVTVRKETRLSVARKLTIVNGSNSPAAIWALKCAPGVSAPAEEGDAFGGIVNPVC